MAIRLALAVLVTAAAALLLDRLLLAMEARGGIYYRRRKPSIRSLGSAMPRHYLLTDRWRDLASLEAFRRDFAEEYEALDRRCEALTEDERLLGYFPLPDAAP